MEIEVELVLVWDPVPDTVQDARFCGPVPSGTASQGNLRHWSESGNRKSSISGFSRYVKKKCVFRGEQQHSKLCVQLTKHSNPTFCQKILFLHTWRFSSRVWSTSSHQMQASLKAAPSMLFGLLFLALSISLWGSPRWCPKESRSWGHVTSSRATRCSKRWSRFFIQDCGSGDAGSSSGVSRWVELPCCPWASAEASGCLGFPCGICWKQHSLSMSHWAQQYILPQLLSMIHE